MARDHTKNEGMLDEVQTSEKLDWFGRSQVEEEIAINAMGVMFQNLLTCTVLCFLASASRTKAKALFVSL